MIASANPELKKVLKMPGMGQATYERGFSEGIAQDISQGMAQGIKAGEEAIGAANAR